MWAGEIWKGQRKEGKNYPEVGRAEVEKYGSRALLEDNKYINLESALMKTLLEALQEIFLRTFKIRYDIEYPLYFRFNDSNTRYKILICNKINLIKALDGLILRDGDKLTNNEHNK